MKILVTGGAGFIGSNLVDELVKQDYDVVVVDNLSTGKEDNLKEVKEKIKFYKIDITDDQKLSEVFEQEKPEAIFHLAAQINVVKSKEDPDWDRQQNYYGSLNVIEKCKNHNVKKIIFSSSAAVYGDTKQIPTKESHPTAPYSPYGENKLDVERHLDKYYNEYNLSYIALRYSNVYGPRQISEAEGGVVAIFCDKVVYGNAPTIYGDGEQTRDLIYVGDVVRANILALESEKIGVYNISTKKEISISSLVDLIKKNTDHPKIEPIHDPARLADQARSALDNSKAKAELDWEPQISLEQGIKQTIEWFRKK